MELDDTSENPTPPLRYRDFQWSRFIAGWIFLGVGIISAVFCNEGMISFIFSFPTFFWVGALPLLVGILFILQAGYRRVTINIEQTDDSVIVRCKRWRSATKSFPRNEIKYVALQYKEGKMRKWLLIFGLFVYLVEILFRNGINLLGAAPLAPFLLFNAILTVIGMGILVAFPRRALEIGTQKESASIPWPSLKRNEIATNKLLNSFGIDLTSLMVSKIFRPAHQNLEEEYSTFIFAILLILVGITLMITPTLFYGQFTAPLALAMGVKYFVRIFKGGKYYIQPVGSTLRGSSKDLTFFYGTIESPEQHDMVTLANFHPLELLGFAYLISQSIKYGFRFIWWPYMGVNPVYFTLGITFIALIFIKLFTPAHQIRCQLSGFPLVLRTIFSIPQESGAARVSLIITKVRDFLNSFRAHKGEKTFLWVVIIFVITVVAPAVYYAFGGNSLFL